MDYLTGYELDQIFRWPYGRAERLARKGQLPHYSLPDGSLRFVRSEVEDLIQHAAPILSNRYSHEEATAPAVPGHVLLDGGSPLGENNSQGGKQMTYEVHYDDGTVEEVEAKNKSEARRMAKDLYDAPIDEIIEADQGDDEEDEDEDPADWDDGDDDDESDDDDED